MRLEEFTLERVIFETRYSIGAFSFFGKAGPLLDEYIRSFEKFAVGTDSLRASRERDRFSVLVGLTRCAFDAQRGDVDLDLDEIFQLGSEIIGNVLVKFQRPEASRIGQRCVFLKAYGAFDESMDIIKQNLQVFTTGPFAQPRHRVADVGIAAVVYEIDDRRRLNVTIGPYSKAELTTKLPIEDDGALPDAAIALDMDYHVQGPQEVLIEGLVRGNITAQNMARALRSFMNRGLTTIRDTASQILGPFTSTGG